MRTDRRFLLALALCVLAMLVSELIFPTPPASKRAPHGADSVAAVAASAAAPTAVAQPGRPGAALPAPPASGSMTASPDAAPSAPAAPPATPTSSVARSSVTTPPETLVVATTHTEVMFSSVGAAPIAVTMRDYRRTVRDVADREATPQVQVATPGSALLRYRMIIAHDTLALDSVGFRGRRTPAKDGSAVVTYDAEVQGRGADRATWHVTIAYAFGPDGYLSRVTGSAVASATSATAAATGSASAGYLLIDLPGGFPSFEADTTDDLQQLAYVVKPVSDDPVSTTFSRLDPGQSELRTGPIAWTAAKNKYFLVGVLAPDTIRAHQIAEVDLVGGPRVEKMATRAAATAVLPLTSVTGGGAFAFDLYVGPQEFRRLRAIGRSFENLNPYAGFLHPILQPFVTIVVELVLWLRQVLQINYGWVLVIFGVGTRLLLWPVNQRAMRTSLKMQRLQPELAEVQTRYKSDPTRQQQEMMRVYKEHGMSPWSPIAGCLPMLLPWPIFAALYFVFRNTIEFRGVPFLWLHDISVRDPHYILPVLMGASSFLVSWIGMRNVPPNPQTKMMSYMFPLMMTFFFWKIAAGLNLYYLVQNVATLPQQWMLSNERARSAGTGGAGGAGAPASPARPRPSGGAPSVPATGRG